MNHKLVEDNINLVYSVIWKHYPNYRFDEDIVQAGMLGLCNAANKWDSEKGNFSTYAWKAILNEIHHEYMRRNKHFDTISLETETVEDGTLHDVIPGDEDLIYFDMDSFYDSLSPDEAKIFSLATRGYTTKEIADKFGYSDQKVRRIYRKARLKWGEFNEKN